MSDAGQITVELVAKLDKLTSGLEEAVSQINGSTSKMSRSVKEGAQNLEVFGDSMNDLRHTMQGLMSPIRGVYNGVGELAEVFLAAFAVERISEFAEKMSELGADALHSAAEIGLSTEAITRFNFAAGAMGMQGDAGALGLQRLERAAVEAAGGERMYSAAFDAMGISVTDAHGKMKSMEVLLPEIANKFAATADGPEKTAIAMEIMGRSGARMIPILDQGAAGMKGMSDAADNAGVTISGPMAEGMEQTAIRFFDLGQSVEGVAITIYEAFKPAIDTILDALIGLVQGFNNGIKSGGDFNKILAAVVIVVDTVIGVILELVTGFEALYDIIEAGAIAVIGPLEVLSHVIYDTFSGHWSQAIADTRAGLATVGTMVVDRLKSVTQHAKDFQSEIGHLFSNIHGLGVDTTGGKAGPEGAPKPSLPPLDITGLGQKLADEKLKAAEQEALAEIKIEEDKNSFLYAMGQRTLEEYVAVQKELEDRTYAVKLEYLQKRAQADAKDKLAHQKDLDAIRLLALQHEEALGKIAQQGAEKRMQLERQATEQYIQDENDRLANAQAALEHDYKMSLLTVEEKAAAERQLTVAIYREELDRVDAEMKSLKEGTEAWNKAYKERQRIAEDMSKAVRKIDDGLAEEQHKKWETLASSIRSTFNSSLNSMILGTMSWQKALGSVIDSVTSAFLNMGEKILEDWIEVQITKALVSKTTGSAAAAGEIQSASGVAMANTFASISAIPIVGPELAPGAAAAAGATVMSFQSLAFAERGMLLDRDRLVFAHKDEQILPASISRGMQDLIARGKTGGDVNLHYQPQVNAPAHKSLNQLLSDESSTMVAWLNARVRDGTLKMR